MTGTHRFVSLFLLLFLVLIGFLGPAAPARAQAHVTMAAVNGDVLDQDGTPLPGAEVVATNVATAVERTTSTDAQGRFVLVALEPGVYRIEARHTGFATQVVETLNLELGAAAAVEFTLPETRIEERVNVVAESAVVDARKIEIATAIGPDQIVDLPIKERDFIEFSLLTKGVTRDLALSTDGVAAASGLSFTGQRARSNNIMVDGFDNNDRTAGAARASFGQESIEEFQVLTSSYSAEFGNASAGVINIVSRSGTNDFSGNAFFFYRDQDLSARHYFEQFDSSGAEIDRDKAPFSQRQWGATFGGPIAEGKTHFFGSYERRDTRASNFVTIDPAAAVALNGAGFPVETGTVPYDVDRGQILGKINHRFSPEHTLVVRANYSDITDENIEPFGGIVAQSRGAVQFREDWALAVSSTNLFDAKWLNEVRFQVGGQDQRVESLDPTCGGPCEGELEGGPTVEITGVASAGRLRTTPQPRDNTRIQINDTLSYFTTTHLVKLGVDFNYSTGTGSLPLHVGGRFIFSPLPAVPSLGIPRPLTSLQAFQLGLPAAYVQGYGESELESSNGTLSLFVQDEWQASPRLAIQAGLRYQKLFWSEFDYRTNGFAESYQFPSDNDDVAPRLGFAFDVTGDKRTNLHGAYGIFYDNHITGLNSVPSIIDGNLGIRTLVVQIPGSIPAWRAPGRRLPEPAVFPSLQFAIDPGLRTPFAHQFSLGVTRAVNVDMSVSADLVYVNGKNQIGTIDYNPLVRSLGPGRRPLDLGGRAGTSSSVLQYTSFGETWYRGLLVGLRKRLSDRYQFLVSYTLSKAEDTSTDFQSTFLPEQNGEGRRDPSDTGLPVGFDPELERGPSVNDQRHRFVFSSGWQLPKGFQLSGIVTAASGRPYNILAGADLNGDGDGGTFPSDRARANLLDPSTSVERNSGRMPATMRVDVRLTYNLSLGANANVDFMAEVFNLFNRTNFTDVNNIFGVGSYPTAPLDSFGEFTAAGDPRQLQLAVKFNF